MSVPNKVRAMLNIAEKTIRPRTMLCFNYGGY